MRGERYSYFIMPRISSIGDPGERQKAWNELRTVDPLDDSRVSVLYYGHSFVRHLRDYVKKVPDLDNWGFSHRQADIHYYSIGGATLDKLLQDEHLWHIEYMKPDVVIVEIATNDLARNGVDYTANKIADKTHKLLLEIQDRGVKRVVINQVLPVICVINKLHVHFTQKYTVKHAVIVCM